MRTLIPMMEHCTTRTLFPGRIEGRPPLNDVYHLPYELQRIYQESRTALMEGLSVLTGMGIRAFVETVCREKNSPGGVLAAQIGGLVSLNLITQTEAEICMTSDLWGIKQRTK